MRVALAAEIELAGNQARQPEFIGRIRYWHHSISAIKWIADRVFKGQRHLLELSDEQFEEILDEWQSKPPT
jgi:hypothetical protein